MVLKIVELTRAELKREKKLEKLDTLLLLLSSSLSLGITIVQAFVNAEWLVYFLPILIPAWIMPVYIGYIRGGMILDSLEERVRGWTYFVAGGGIYLVIYLLAFIGNPAKNIASPTIRMISPYLGISFEIAILATAIYFVPDIIFKIFRQTVTSDMRKAVLYTIVSSAFAGAFFFYIVDGIDIISKISTSNNLVIIISIIIWISVSCLFFYGFQYFERKARRLIENL